MVKLSIVIPILEEGKELDRTIDVLMEVFETIKLLESSSVASS